MIPFGKPERELLRHDFSVDRLQERMKQQGYATMAESALAMMEEGILSPGEAMQIAAGEASYGY